MNKRAIFTCGFTIFGLLIAYVIVIVGIRIPEITQSYWPAAVTMTAIIFIYFISVHPRLRPFPGYEYAALLVGLSSIMPLAAIFLAVTHAEIH